MKKLMLTLTGICLAAFLPCLICYILFEKGIFLTLSISFGTCLYHFLMRLAVGGIIDGIFHNKVNYKLKIFAPKPFEKPIYRFLKVKKWKRFMPTFSPESFDIKKNSVEDLIMASCQAEMVHAVICALSFLPLLLIIPFGDPWVFILTSFFAFLIDLSFIVIQRFNRPRLFFALTLYEKRLKKGQ